MPSLDEIGPVVLEKRTKYQKRSRDKDAEKFSNGTRNLSLAKDQCL